MVKSLFKNSFCVNGVAQVVDLFYINKEDHKNSDFIKRLLIPTILIGIFMITSGVFIKFPQFLIRKSLSWVVYSIGIDLFLLSIFLSIEKFSIFRTKRSYKLIFYYSYYSFTIYLAHNLLYFLFLNKLDLISIWFFAVAAFFSMGFILRAIYKRLGEKASIKVQIGKFSLGITIRIEKNLSKREELNEYR